MFSVLVSKQRDDWSIMPQNTAEAQIEIGSECWTSSLPPAKISQTQQQPPQSQSLPVRSQSIKL